MIILAVLLFGFVFVIFLLLRKRESGDETIRDWLKNIDARLDRNSQTINDSLFKQTQEMLHAQRAIYSKMEESAKSIGEMSEIGKSMKDMQQFLASPKLRGGLGEQLLRELLEQSLPKESFKMQHGFKSGVRVDAIIKTASGLIPIDSKFSIENFKKMIIAPDESIRVQSKKEFHSDVKDRIDEIAQKYILSDEGTVDFALMYVPTESVYYEIVNSEPDLMAYAHKKRVMPVSPSTFYAFLRSVLLSFEGQKIASEIKTIQQSLRAIHTETSKFGGLLTTLQSHITNSYNMMNKVANQFVGLSSKVESVQGLGEGVKEETKELEI